MRRSTGVRSCPKGHQGKCHKQTEGTVECDRIVSFGDSLNDISMFRISDECYAVENAAPALKSMLRA